MQLHCVTNSVKYTYLLNQSSIDNHTQCVSHILYMYYCYCYLYYRDLNISYCRMSCTDWTRAIKPEPIKTLSCHALSYIHFIQIKRC